MRRAPRRLSAGLALALAAAPMVAQQAATTAPGGTVRVLDKITGMRTDLDLANGETREIGHLTITLGECRYPSGNAAGDAFMLLTIYYQTGAEPVFRGWMIASAPALNALDHPRYDVWALRCTTS